MSKAALSIEDFCKFSALEKRPRMRKSTREGFRPSRLGAGRLFPSNRRAAWLSSLARSDWRSERRVIGPFPK